MPFLVEYIAEQKKRGYNNVQIRSYLLSLGYAEAQIDSEIKRSSGTAGYLDQHGRFNIAMFGKRRVFLIIIPVILILAAILFFDFLGSGGGGSDFEVNNLLDKSDYEIGEALRFLVSVKPEKSTDVKLTINLIKLSDNSITKTKTRYITEETGSRIPEEFLLTDIEPGEYDLVTVADFGGTQRYSYSPFTVVDGEGDEYLTVRGLDLIDPEDDTETVAAESSYVNQEYPNAESGLLNNTGITIQLTAEEKTITIDDIIAVSTENKSLAEEQCLLLGAGETEVCFSGVAEKLMDSSICEKIETMQVKDTCYANIALAGDYTACDKIQDEFQKRACNIIKERAEG